MAPLSSTPHSSTPLASGWTFKQGGLKSGSSYLPAHDVPTEVHRDLAKNSIIADPFLDLNELSVRWVADETWTYRTTFVSPSEHQVTGLKTFLTFQGLDTFASAYLNGKSILESDNMFVEHRVNISDIIEKAGVENALEIEFQSARKRGLELVKEHPEHKFIVHQTEISRGPVRKAQYHWGWDWGPILLTCGPWKPITLDTYTLRIEDCWVEYEISDDLKDVKGKLYARVEGLGEGLGEVSFRLQRAGHGNNPYSFEPQKNSDGIFEASFDLSAFEGAADLWWPRGYGAQTLYSFTATIIGSDGKDVHVQSKTIGFRKVELVQENDSIGTTFYIRVNNTDIFCGGSCWIPADSLLSSISDDRYRDWVKLAAEGNQTMIRVWGGGIYEPTAFYSACDEFGILVWQDFMFACANYPAYPSYLESVETEARQNVKRLRNHVSVVLWAGNNEDYQIVERYGLEYKFTEDKDPESWLKIDFPARYLYEHLLPKIVKEETKGIPYHPSSPWGNGTSTTLKVDPTVGDIHQWNVWHGEMKPYQKLPEMGGRFVSEFGMEAYPHLETMAKCITKEEDRYPGSMAMDFRNKAIGHERRLISYVSENFFVKYDLKNFTHLSQVMQADAMSWAYKSWRRDWGAKDNRKCGGVLVWQLNDCWPTISWAVVDYYLVPKPAYYAIKRTMEPVIVGVTRKTNDWTMRPADELWKRDTSHVDMRKIWEDIEFDVWIASSKTEKLKGVVALKFFSIKSGQEVLQKMEKDVLIEANGTTEAIRNQKVSLPEPQDPNTAYDTSKADPFVVYASLSIDGKEVATDVSWPDPIKYLSFPDRDVNVEYSDDQSTLTVSASKPVKGFVFSDTQNTKLSDNGFDLVPGERKEVRVTGGSPKELKWKYVQQ